MPDVLLQLERTHTGDYRSDEVQGMADRWPRMRRKVKSAQRISVLSTAPARAGCALRTEWRYCQQSHFGCKAISHVGCRKRCTAYQPLGQGPQCRADRNSVRMQPQCGVRQIAAHGLEARAQASNRKAQDRVGSEAKASAVGGLCPPGG